MAALLLASCAAPNDQIFRDAFTPNTTAARIGDRLQERLVARFPPGQADMYEAVHYLSQAGARCRPAEDGAQRCTYTLLRPPGGQGEGPLDSQEFVHFDIDLIPEGPAIKDIQVRVN